MFSKIVAFAVLTIIVAEASVIPVAPVVVERRAPQPYAFGYNIKDELSQQSRQEESDGVVVRGNYGFADARGIQRQVVYIADDAGFRAEVRTNEPGTANQNPAAVRLISTAPKPVLTPVARTVVAPVTKTFVAPVTKTFVAPVAQYTGIAPVGVVRDTVLRSGAVFENVGYPRFG